MGYVKYSCSDGMCGATDCVKCHGFTDVVLCSRCGKELDPYSDDELCDDCSKYARCNACNEWFLNTELNSDIEHGEGLELCDECFSANVPTDTELINKHKENKG